MFHHEGDPVRATAVGPSTECPGGCRCPPDPACRGVVQRPRPQASHVRAPARARHGEGQTVAPACHRPLPPPPGRQSARRPEAETPSQYHACNVERPAPLPSLAPHPLPTLPPILLHFPLSCSLFLPKRPGLPPPLSCHLRGGRRPLRPRRGGRQEPRAGVSPPAPEANRR